MKKIILLLVLTVSLVAGDLEKEKRFGFEINPLLLLSAGTVVSGGFSYFDIGGL